MGLEEYAGNLLIVPRQGLNNALVSTDFGKLISTSTLTELREQAHDEGARVVILDNAAQLFGGSENDRHSVTAFLNWLAGALKGMAVLLLAHPSRSLNSEFSGSSAWENVARTRLYLGASLPDQKADEEPQPDVRYLSRRKSNYSAKDWRRCSYADGVLVPDAQENAGGIVGVLRTAKAERVVLAGIRKLEARGLHATDGASSPRFLPRLFKEYELCDGLTKSELAEGMRRLLMDGKIERGAVGRTDSRNAQFGLRCAPSAATD